MPCVPVHQHGDCRLCFAKPSRQRAASDFGSGVHAGASARISGYVVRGGLWLQVPQRYAARQARYVRTFDAKLLLDIDPRAVRSTSIGCSPLTNTVLTEHDFLSCLVFALPPSSQTLEPCDRDTANFKSAAVIEHSAASVCETIKLSMQA